MFKKNILYFLFLICLLNLEKSIAQPMCTLTNPDATTITYECPQSVLFLTGHAPYNNITAKGRAFVKFGAGNNNQYKKPIILVEGLDLDLRKNGDQGDRIGDRGWPNFIAGISNESEPSDVILNNLPILLNDLNGKGYDLIYLDHDDGATYMQANAMVLVSLINTINNLKIGGEPIIIVGASMGGQTAKYALSYMEKNNIKHCVSEYISFDSPHKGANIPLSLQALVNHYAPVDPKINDLKDKLNLVAPQQLLNNHYHAVAEGESALRTNWLSDLNAIGNYPKKTRNVAVINGSLDNLIPFSDGKKMLEIRFNAGSGCNNGFVNWGADLYAGCASTLYDGVRPLGANFLGMYTNIQLCIGSCPFCQIAPYTYFHTSSLSSNFSCIKYDNSPGSKRNTIQAFSDAIKKGFQKQAGDLGIFFTQQTVNVFEPDHTFISSISALDVNTNNLNFHINSNIPNSDLPNSLHPFEAFYGPIGNNETHVEFTGNLSGGNIKWIIQELGGSENKLSYVNNILASSSPNGGNFNFARLANRFLRSVTVNNGGKLFVNANLASDFGLATPGTAPAQTNPYPVPTPGSTYTLETCNCNNVIVDIGNNGQFILGETSPNNKAIVIFHETSSLFLRNSSQLIVNENSQLIIKSGAKFQVESGAKIIIKNGGKIIVEPNAQFILHPNTEIQLKGANSLLDVQNINTFINLSNSTEQILFTNASGNSQGGLAQFAGGDFSHGPGSKFIIENCTVRFLYDSKVPSQMTYHYFTGSDLQLQGDKAVLDLQGDLFIGNGAKFTFTWSGNTKHGYLKFSRPGWWGGNTVPHIIIGKLGNCSFELIGKSISDKMMEVAQETVYLPDDGKFLFTCKNSKVEFTIEQARLQIPCDYDVQYSTFICPNYTSLTAPPRGLILFGQNTRPINNCIFNNFGLGGIDAELFYGGNKLFLNNNYFTNASVFVSGRGADITQCIFTKGYFPLYFFGSNLNSNVKNCSFTSTESHIKGDAGKMPISGSIRSFEYSPASGLNAHLNGSIGVYSEKSNPVLLNLDNCIIKGFEVGAGIEQGLLNVNCGEVKNNDFGFAISTNGKLYMSTTSTPLGGKVDAEDNGISIFSGGGGEINILNGFNNLRPNVIGNAWNTVTYSTGSCPHCTGTYITYTEKPVIYGTLLDPAAPSCITSNSTTIAADKNHWKSNLFNGTQYRVDSVSTVFYDDCFFPGTLISPYRVYYQDPSELTKNQFIGCSASGPCTSCRTTPIANCTNCSSINTSQLGVTTSNNAAKTADNDNAVNTAISNKKALSLYSDVLKSNIRTTGSSEDKYVNGYSHHRLQQAFADVYEQQQIPDSLPTQPDFANAIQALDAQITPLNTNNGNYNHTMFTLIEKGELYRMSRLRQDALNTFNQALALAQTQNHIDYINKLICMTNVEINALANLDRKGEYSSKVDSCSARKINFMLASARTNNSNISEQDNSSKFINENINSNFELKVYPNPTNGELYIAYKFEEAGSNEFIITDVTGKAVFSIKLQDQTNIVKADGKDLSSGIYFYQLKQNGKTVKTDKLIISK